MGAQHEECQYPLESNTHFNMQAEAAIPEDILDQQHIEDVDAFDAEDSMQYVGESDVDGYAAIEPEADIILAAQKFSTSESNREEEEEYLKQNNNDSGDNNKRNNNKIVHLKKSVGKRNNKLKSDADNSDNNNNKYDSDNGNAAVYNDQMDELDGLDVSDEEPLALPSTHEAKSFRLTKDPKEQQNEGLIAEDEDSDEKGVRDVTGQHVQLMENLVAEKFNKASVQTIHNEKKAKDTHYSYGKNNNNSRSNMNNSHDDGDDDAADVQDENNKNSVINTSNNISKQVNNKSEMEYTDGNQLEEIAIGDIEDKFRNEDEDALQQQQQLEQEHKNAASHGGRRGGSEQVALAGLMEKNDDEDVEQSEKFVAKKIKRHERADIASHDESKNNKNLNSDNNSNNHNKHTYKRHHYGEPHKENEQYGNTFAHKPVAEKVAMPKNQQHEQQQQQDEGIEEKLEVADSNGSSDEKGPQTDYSITYFGILTNSSQRREEEEEKDYVRELPLNASEYSAKTTNIVAKIANSDDAAKLEVVHATRNQQQQQQYEQQHQLTDETPDAGESYATHMSAFEHYKAQRRNSRRYGHKMYKKKYKDYLSYATMSSLTAGAMGIAIEATTTAVPEISTALSAQANVIAMSAEHTINSTQAKMTNNSYTDYYRKQDQEQQQQQQQWQRQHLQLQQQQREEPISVRAQKHAEKLRKYARKIEAEKSRRLPASPIFVVGNRNGGAVAATIDSSSSRSGEGANPFYEGQINYYLETRDEEDTEGTAATEANNKTIDGNGEGKENADVAGAKQREERLRAHGGSMERMIAADNSNWYQRVSPVLRNGIKVFSNEGKHLRGEATSNQKQNVHKQQKHQQHDAQHTHHYERNHYQHQHHQHHHQHQHQQHHRQHPHPHMHAYKQQQQHHGIHQHRRGGSGNHHKHRQHGKHYQSTDTRQLQQQQHTSNPYQRILPTSLLSPPSPHASATQAAVEMGMVQTPIPPPSYTKQHQQQQQTEAEAVGSGAQQLGHQITELEELERYYAKWPHLARVQFQVYDEHYREAHPELYPEMKDDADEDYDDDYESAAELEEAQNGHDEDANLPPYIKKYNRRNKQLLNLLEGTLAPPTRPPPAIMRSWSSSLLQPGPHASSRSAGGGGGNGVGRVRIDDDYLKEKRKRYHNRDISSTSTSSVSGSNNNNRKEDLDHYQDLFAQQRPPSTTTTEIPDTLAGGSANKEDSSATKKVQNKANIRSTVEKAAQSTNQLPDEDVSISTDTDADADTDTDIDAYAADDADVDIWPKEIENKSNANELTGSAQMTWQIEKLTTPKPMQHLPITPSTPKPAIYRLPSYPAIAGSFIGKPRSRSAQFAPSGGSRGKLAFVAAAGDDLHSNRWSNIYGRGGGIIGNYGGGGDSNGLGLGLGIGGNHHKSLSRFSAYKPNAHKALTAAAALTATSTTAPTFLWHAAGADMDGNGLTTAATAITVTPSGGSSSDDGDGAEGGVPNGGVGRTISSFVYHRVIDASPRLVGTGATGRKQRLPFVAITDRRLETTKKALLERQKDFEQNHYPMP
ncbi:uncharacterized protein LOC128857560 [Anastrepha ludens]|uniref:uncharacterized protein LOC128857560 n=1 Tax=Anastrepha ludens TaxID=28586 RepID=UPI0023B194FC|nr:uncharacterized protein LOC128857560 [Anastrepha ludens]